MTTWTQEQIQAFVEMRLALESHSDWGTPEACAIMDKFEMLLPEDRRGLVNVVPPEAMEALEKARGPV